MKSNKRCLSRALLERNTPASCYCAYAHPESRRQLLNLLLSIVIIVNKDSLHPRLKIAPPRHPTHIALCGGKIMFSDEFSNRLGTERFLGTNPSTNGIQGPDVSTRSLLLCWFERQIYTPFIHNAPREFAEAFQFFKEIFFHIVFFHRSGRKPDQAVPSLSHRLPFFPLHNENSTYISQEMSGNTGNFFHGFGYSCCRISDIE